MDQPVAVGKVGRKKVAQLVTTPIERPSYEGIVRKAGFQMAFHRRKLLIGMGTWAWAWTRTLPALGQTSDSPLRVWQEVVLPPCPRPNLKSIAFFFN